VALKVASVSGDRRSDPVGRAPLGIDAKSVDRPRDAEGAKTGGGRSMRYRLKRLVERLLFVEDAPKQERVCTCHRRRKGEKVSILKDTKTGRAHFNGLESCSNVWTCPVCSLVITEHRRRELQDAITAWMKAGGEVYLMTLTMPHVRADNLVALLALLRAASKRFCQDKLYRRMSKLVGRVGNIRSLEVTWGSWHGWHPHFHILVFAKRGQLDELAKLRTAWVNALLKVKAAGNDQVNDLLAHAFDVQNGMTVR